VKRPGILLVNPWIHDFAAYDLWARPMGLLVLASRLRRQGWEPMLVDCLDPDHPRMKREKVRPFADGRFARTPILRPAALEGVPRAYSRYGVDPQLVKDDLSFLSRPSIILVTSLMTYWYPGVAETIRLLREIFPNVPVVLGGEYASILPEHAMKHSGADEVVSGPGELTLSHTLFQLTGLAPARNESENVLEFSPALNLMRHVRFIPLLTSRGCPFRCAYCASRRIVPGFVQRGPGEVLAEIRAARNRYQALDIALYDDAFLVNARNHALPILEEAAAEFSDMRWHTPNGLHASAIDPRLANAMKRAGFQTIRLGLESASDEFHRRTGGKTRLKEFSEAAMNLRDAGFGREQIGVYLLVGLPGQSRTQIEDDVDRVLSLGATPKLAEYSPIPGTVLWRDAVNSSRYPIEEEPLFHNCTLLPAANAGVDSAFLQELRRKIRESENHILHETSQEPVSVDSVLIS